MLLSLIPLSSLSVSFTFHSTYTACAKMKALYFLGYIYPLLAFPATGMNGLGFWRIPDPLPNLSHNQMIISNMLKSSGWQKMKWPLLFWPLCAVCGILVPRPGMEPAPRKCSVLTTGPPGKSQYGLWKILFPCHFAVHLNKHYKLAVFQLKILFSCCWKKYI